MVELKSNPHVAYELYMWNKHGSGRIDQGLGRIPEDPRFLFKVLETKKASKTDPETVITEEYNSIQVGCKIGSVTKGIAEWAKRCPTTTGPIVGPGAPGKLTGGYCQVQMASLPDSLCIEVTRHDWETGNTCTDRLVCPGFIDFAGGDQATALAPGVAPCQYRLVGVQVGELQGKHADPNYITWWGYVWDEGRLTWHVMDDGHGSLRPVSSTEVVGHLDVESSEATFPMKLYYRKIPPTKPLPDMPKHLIDWDSPWGYIKVPRKGPLQWVTGTDGKPLLPIPDDKQERFTLVDKVVSDPALGSFGTIYVQMIGRKFPLPVDDVAAFANRERNFNIGGPGDKFVVVGFTPQYRGDTPSDAILNDEREPWPTRPGSCHKVDRLDPCIPRWAKSWNGTMQLGMPIPSWLAVEVAAQMAYYKHVHFNMLRRDLVTWWDKLDVSIAEIFAKSPGARTHLLTSVWRELTSVRHGHVTQLDVKFNDKMKEEPSEVRERMTLPAPRSVEALNMLIERMHIVANKNLKRTSYRVANVTDITEDTIRKLSPFTFDRPSETLDDTANRFYQAMKNAMEKRDSKRAVPPPKKDPAAEAEREQLKRKALEANAWLEAKRKERDDKLAAPMLAEQKRKQEAKEQAKAAEEASAKAKLREQLESERRGAEARERAQKEEADRKAVEAEAAKEAAKAARLAAAQKKKAAKKESRKTPLQREQEAQAAAAAKEKEDNDAMVARVEKKLAAIALAKQSA